MTVHVLASSTKSRRSSAPTTPARPLTKSSHFPSSSGITCATGPSEMGMPRKSTPFHAERPSSALVATSAGGTSFDSCARGVSPGMTVILGAQIDHARGEPLGFAVDLEH